MWVESGAPAATQLGRAARLIPVTTFVIKATITCRFENNKEPSTSSFTQISVVHSCLLCTLLYMPGVGSCLSCLSCLLTGRFNNFNSIHHGHE